MLPGFGRKQSPRLSPASIVRTEGATPMVPLVRRLGPRTFRGGSTPSRCAGASFGRFVRDHRPDMGFRTGVRALIPERDQCWGTFPTDRRVYAKHDYRVWPVINGGLTPFAS